MINSDFPLKMEALIVKTGLWPIITKRRFEMEKYRLESVQKNWLTKQELSEMDQLIDLIREETEAAGLDLRDICSIECPDCGFLIMI